MKLILCITFLFIHIIPYGDCNTYAFDPDNLRKCYVHLLCDLNKVQDLQEILAQSGPKIEERSWNFIESATGVTGPNTVENCSKYRTVYCDYTEEVKKQVFEGFCKLYLDYWLRVCMNRYSSLCKDADHTAVVASDYYKGHMKDGDCKNVN